MPAILGRSNEIDEVGRFLDAVGDRFQVMVLSGQAGIGKTTIWSAGIGAARDRDVRVLVARPTEVETGLAFAGLADLLDPLIDEFGPGLPPPQREALEAALLRRAAGSPPQPLGVGLAVLGVLRDAGAARPTVVAIDDVPWLDEPSARALEFAVRRLDADRVGFLLARRAASPDEPLPHWIATVAADRLRRIDVGPLSIDETAALLRERLGLALSRMAAVRVHAISGGAPFYAIELGRELQSRGGRMTSDAVILPRSLDDLIGARFAGLEPAADEVALYAAALSQPTAAALEAALGQARTEAGLEAAHRAGILDVADGSIRFSHPLLAAAAYGRAAAERRRQVHDHLASIVDDPEERAKHLARAAAAPDRTVAATLEAGSDAALRRGAPDVAAELVEEAAALTPADAKADRRRRFLVAAERYVVAGDMARAEGLCSRVAAELPDGPDRAGVLARRALITLMLGRLDDAEQLLLEAQRMAERDVRLRIAIHSLLAGIGYLSWRGWRHARLDAFEALRLAGEIDDAAVELQMLGHAASWNQALGRPWRTLLERADSLDVPLADVPALEHPDVQFARILATEGQPAEARRRLERLIGSARAIGDWTSIPRLQTVLAQVEIDAGDLDRADRVASEAEAGLLQTGGGAFAHDLRRVRLVIRALRGEPDAARAATLELEQLDRDPMTRWVRTDLRFSLADLELSAGNHAGAHEELNRIVCEPGPGRLSSIGWELVVADAVEALVGLGRAVEGRRLLERVERRARRRGVPAAIAELDRARGLILAAEGAHDEAVQAAEAAVEGYARLEVPYRLARAWFSLGEVRRRARQKRASHDAFESALALFSQVGALAWVERTRAEAGRVAARRPPGSPLTDTERQVADLAAAGRTNREIADAMFMSVHTVEAHMTRIFRTLGVHTRTELAQAVLGGGSGAASGAGGNQHSRVDRKRQM